MCFFVRTVKPFVSADEYRVTENLAKNFSSAGSIGEKLQKLLEERAAKTENWVSSFLFLKIIQIFIIIFLFSSLIGG